MMRKILFVTGILLNSINIVYATELGEYSIFYPKDLPGFTDEGERSIRRGIIKGISLQKNLTTTTNDQELQNLAVYLINNTNSVNNEIGNYFLSYNKYKGYLIVQEHVYLSNKKEVKINLSNFSKEQNQSITNVLKESIKQNPISKTWYSYYYIVKYVPLENENKNIIEKDILQIINTSSSKNYSNSLIPLKKDSFYFNAINIYGTNGVLLNEEGMRKIRNEVKR